MAQTRYWQDVLCCGMQPLPFPKFSSMTPLVTRTLVDSRANQKLVGEDAPPGASAVRITTNFFDSVPGMRVAEHGGC
jgi:hypothetical protein